jgi:hypothetical protein
MGVEGGKCVRGGCLGLATACHTLFPVGSRPVWAVETTAPCTGPPHAQELARLLSSSPTHVAVQRLLAQLIARAVRAAAFQLARRELQGHQFPVRAQDARRSPIAPPPRFLSVAAHAAPE